MNSALRFVFKSDLSHPSEFLQEVRRALADELVISPETLVVENFLGDLVVVSEHLTSSEAEALVKVMRCKMILPISVSGTGHVLDENSSVCFISADNEIMIEFSHFSFYLFEELKFKRGFVLVSEPGSSGPSKEFYESAMDHLSIPISN